MADDILVLPDVAEGKKSLRIADVHGGLHAFTQMLASLKKGDRAICIGDLVDRGAANGGDDYGVIAAIIQHNKDIANGEDKGEFYSARGNHEENIINAIHEFEKNISSLLNQDGTLNEEAFNHFCLSNRTVALALHKNNGGQWLVDLFKEELLNKNITVDQSNGKPVYEVESKIQNVKTYMEKLPYLIVADNTINGHADIPLSDKELFDKIKTGDLSLTPEQKEYVVWARKDDNYTPFRDYGRTRNSMLAFVGHNIVQKYGDHYTPSVRHRTNTINLDVASYLYGVIFAVDVNNPGDVLRFGQLRDAIIEEYPHDFYSAEEASINDHMADQYMLFNMLREVKACQTLEELDAILNNYANHFEGIYGSNNYYDESALFDSVMRHRALSENLLKNIIFEPLSQVRLLLSGFDRSYELENETTISDYISDYPELSRVYIQTLLIDAINNGDNEAANDAIERGASLFCPMSNGQTPLELIKDDVVMIDLLIASAFFGDQADDEELNLKDKYANTGWTEYHYHAITDSEEEFLEITKDNDPNTPELLQQATMPVGCLNALLYTIVPKEKADLLEAVLDGFYKDRLVEMDEDGCVKVTPQDLRYVFTTMDKTEKLILAQQESASKVSKSGLFGQASKSAQSQQAVQLEQEPTEKSTVTLSRNGGRNQ